MNNKGKRIQLCLEEAGASLTSTGAISVFSGQHTGRCPEAKHIVRDETTEDTVDWEANQPFTQEEWKKLYNDVTVYIKTHKHYGKDFETVTAYAGKPTKWLNRTRRGIKFICEKRKQEAFIHNMFEVPEKPIQNPACTVYCIPGASDEAKVVLNFKEKCIIITGTDYLGEIKKSVFTYMNYVLTENNILPMHCSINVDKNHENPVVFFGLSGTGKTTLSSSPNRVLLGDDEHGWIDSLLFNIESGCYAKTFELSEQSEPEIYRASLSFGAVLENVTIDEAGKPDFFNCSVTKNGRVSYPIDYLPRYVKEGFVLAKPSNIVMLTCDAFGVLPPVSRLTPKQAKEMFLIGYTSKVAGTETNITEPQAVFSSCFGAPFLPRRPSVYGGLLQSLLEKNQTPCWLVNTGWVGGPYGVGKRIPLAETREIIESITNGSLDREIFDIHTHTGFSIPRIVPNSSVETKPERSWKKLTKYTEAAKTLMELIRENSPK